MRVYLVFFLLFALVIGLLSGCTPEEVYSAKPVIYLYPETETEVTVALDYAGELTCAYPTMEGNSWTVTASPTGMLTDQPVRPITTSTGRVLATQNTTSPKASAFPATKLPLSWRMPWPSWGSPWRM